MLKNIICLFAYLIISPIFCQESTELDSSSTISYVDKIIFKINLHTQTDSYKTNNSSNNTTFDITPNSNLKLDLSVDYKFIGLSIGFSPKFLPGNDDNDLKGKSSFTDYKFRFFIGNWTQELQYQRTQGYYVENTQDFIPDWVDGVDPYLQLPNFKTIFWGASTSYVVNPEFSLRNVVYNTEWQRKSAGSFIPTLRYGFSRISSIISGSKIYDNSYQVSFAASYYYTWVIHENWFVSPFLSPSFGTRFSKEGEKGIELKEKNTYWPIDVDGGLQLGYSSRRLIFGANINFETTWYNETNQTNVIKDKVFAKVYLGFRFDPPSIVEKLFN